MQLYERDYATLSVEEETQWRSLQQQEIVSKIGTLTVRKSLFRDYPKAVRHFINLFPNNYLDIVELKDETRLNGQLDQFRHLFNSKDVTERSILRFIHQHRAYFIVGSILRHFQFGHHEAHLFREFQLGNSFQVDFLLVGKGSGGWRFVFVELESPAGNITLKDGDLGSAFRKGISQVEDWGTWIESQYGSLRETFDKYRHRDLDLPREFVTLDKSRINYVVLAGRRTDFNDKTYRQCRKKQKENSVLILHYDNLIDAAQDVIGKRTY